MLVYPQFVAADHGEPKIRTYFRNKQENMELRTAFGGTQNGRIAQMSGVGGFTSAMHAEDCFLSKRQNKVSV